MFVCSYSVFCEERKGERQGERERKRQREERERERQSERERKLDQEVGGGVWRVESGEWRRKRYIPQVGVQPWTSGG